MQRGSQYASHSVIIHIVTDLIQCWNTSGGCV
jgi:hypothetical protein